MPRCVTGLIAAFLFTLCGEAFADDASLAARLGGILHWGGDAEGGAPYAFRDPTDATRVIGFEVELMDAVAARLTERLGSKIEARFVQYQWESLPLGLAKRDFDAIASGMEITPENRKKMLFARPYYVYSQQLVVRAAEERIRSLEDCRNLTVGTLSGAAAEQVLESHGVKNVRTYSEQNTPYTDLALGRIDAVLLDLPIAAYYAAKDPRLKFLYPKVGRGEYGIALRPEDRELAAHLDDAIGEIIADGELARILRKWGIWNQDQAALARPSARELAGLGFTADGKPLDGDQREGSAESTGDVAAESARSWTFDRYAPLLLQAAGMTVALSLASMALAMALGLVVCTLRLYGPAPVRAAALVYVEFFRGIPLLLLLTFLYYGLPELGVKLGLGNQALDLGPIGAAIVGFGLNYAAYEAEIYRSAIVSVPKGQWEAARALGMSGRLAFRRIIFPQAFRTALGPMTNDFVAMFKDTSLVSVIAVQELTKEYQILAKSSLKFVELGLLTAALYLAMSVPLGYLSRWLENRWGAGRT